MLARRVLYYCRRRRARYHSSVALMPLCRYLLLPPNFAAHRCCLLFSPKILRSKLLHGSWMDVGDFVNLDAGFIILDVEFCWISLVSGSAFLELCVVVMPALEGVC